MSFHLLPGIVTNLSYDVVTSESLVTEHSTSGHCFGERVKGGVKGEGRGREGGLGVTEEDEGVLLGARGA